MLVLLPSWRTGLTHNLDVQNSGVHVVLHLHGHLVLAGVLAVGFAYEEDGITVCVADVDLAGLHCFTVL